MLRFRAAASGSPCVNSSSNNSLNSSHTRPFAVRSAFRPAAVATYLRRVVRPSFSTEDLR